MNEIDWQLITTTQDLFINLLPFVSEYYISGLNDAGFIFYKIIYFFTKEGLDIRDILSSNDFTYQGNPIRLEQYEYQIWENRLKLTMHWQILKGFKIQSSYSLGELTDLIKQRASELLETMPTPIELNTPYGKKVFLL